jgi:CheY-like chemotaxis protein
MQSHETLLRRQFLGNVAATATSASVLGTGLALAAEPAAPAAPLHKIKVGIIGCGGRGSWIAGLFKQHGGYEFVAAADYFQDRAERAGTSLGASTAKCFSGLSGYKRLLESGVEAVILETPPYCFPDHAEAAVQAGLHVYMAKPVAADVPGTLRIGAAGKAAAAKRRVFLVDYQMPTDPLNLEVCKRLREGGLGTLQMVFSVGTSGGGGFNDPPHGATLESRLTGLTNFVTYVFDDGLAWNHESAAGATHDWLKQGSLEASIQGSDAAARLAYWGKAYVRGGPKHYGGGTVADLYEAGAKRNIAAFHANVLAGNCGNETAQRSVDSTLTCILGREAARRGALLTMDDILKENKRLEVDLKGLKA